MAHSKLYEYILLGVCGKQALANGTREAVTEDEYTPMSYHVQQAP